MSLHNSMRKPHRHNTLDPVQVVNPEKEPIIGIVISKLHKVTKNGKPDEPYYIISGYGPAVWEGDLIAVSEEDYMIFLAKGGVK